MELFTIHCTTCKARLIVKDESAIGDILACPKCQSMVQVVPPPDWKPSVASPQAPVNAPRATAPAKKLPQRADNHRQLAAKSDSTVKAAADKTTTDKSAVKAAAVVPPALPARHTPPEISRPAASAAALAPAAIEVRPTLPVGSSAVSAIKDSGSAIRDSGAVARAGEAPPAVGNSPGEMSQAATPGMAAALLARAKRDWLLLGGGLTGGVVLGAVAWLAVWWSSPTAQPAHEPDAPRTVAVAPAEQPPPAAASPAVAAPAVAEPTVSAEPAAADAANPATSVPPAAPTPEKQPAADVPAADASDAAPEQPAPVASEAPEPVSPPAPAVEQDESAPKAALKLDPVAQNSLPANIAVPALNEFAPSATSPEAQQLEPAQAADAPAATEAAAGGVPANELMPVSEIERHLGVSLSRVEFAETTLGHFAAFLGDVSGVPVILDEPALAQAGKSRKTKISLALTATTALAVLQKGAAAADLQYVIEPGRIVISTRR